MEWFQYHEESHTWTLKAMYQVMHISKQGFHQHMARMTRSLEEQQTLLVIVDQVREDHPTMSSRQMYHLVHPETIGRDKFEAMCFAEGYKVEKKRAFHRTTVSTGVIRFPNLIAGRELTSVNQVWVSDITYYRIEEIFYFLTFITDVYSRHLIGYSVSSSLFTTETTIPALKMAVRKRKMKPKEIHAELILHSDGGGQYYSKDFLKVTSKYTIINSMGKNAYENPHAERINGIIKNDYLVWYKPKDFEDLKQKVAKAVRMYNEQRPHSCLRKMNPVAFELSGKSKPTIIKAIKTQN
jgi:putative transposase